MKKLIYKMFAACLLLTGSSAIAQSIHFSQYYNAPLLMNPANTAQMPDNDFRLGVNYRNQWASIPVPYSTFSGYADFRLLSKDDYGGDRPSSWLGLGAALFDDKAGSGNLSLFRMQGFAAYHLGMGEYSMLSVGLAGGYSQRSVNYNDLTFDAQWDGFTFNPSLLSNEKAGIIKTDYYNVDAGINYTLFPNDNTYVNIGIGAANINQPTESFYGQKNQLGIRPTANVDMLFKMSDKWILDPSAYYTWDKDASELLFGSLFRIYLSGTDKTSIQLILGAYYRWNESVIGVVGFQWGNLQFTTSYDATVSALAPYNNGNGAMEFSLIYQGTYKGAGGRRNYNCPRFF